MRTLLLIGIPLGLLWLYGRRGRADRGSAEVAIQKATAEVVSVLGVALGDVAEGGRQIWDEATTVTGAPALEGGAKGAAITSTSGTGLALAAAAPELLQSVEPVPR